MKKVTAVLLGAALTGTAAGWVATAWAQSLAPHKGDNPAAVCTKAVGVTFYPAQELGCFRRAQSGGCHCDDWVLETPGSTPNTSPAPGWSDHGANASSGWSDERMNERFLDHLGDKESSAKGRDKAELREDVKAFRANLEAQPE